MTNGGKKRKLTPLLMNPSTTVHACDARGIKRCGDTQSGDQRQNVEKYPEEWAMVTCDGCIATK